MNVRPYFAAGFAPFAAAMILVACSSDSDSGGAPMVDTQGDAQTPATGSKLEPWLASGAYKSWHCESAVHASRSPSPHQFNRICTNDLVTNNVAGTQDWPKGAAAVKELYKSATDTAPAGYAVYLKMQSDSAGGSNWYWYERTPNEGVVADGLGSGGAPKSICVSCHVGAGSDPAHTPSAGGRDQVYTPVR